MAYSFFLSILEPQTHTAWRYYPETDSIYPTPAAKRAVKAEKGAAEPQFPKLPAELRVVIWKFALQSGSRVIRPLTTPPPHILAPMPGNLAVSLPPPLPLLCACREANAVAAARNLPPPPRPLFVRFHSNMVFFPRRDYEQLLRTLPEDYYPVFPASPLGPASVYHAREIAVEHNWEVDQSLDRKFILFTTHCRSLERLYLVIRCDAPTQRALSRGHAAAWVIHRRYIELAGVHALPPRDIFILLQRPKDDECPADDVWSSRSGFLSRFVAVLYSHNLCATIERNGLILA